MPCLRRWQLSGQRNHREAHDEHEAMPERFFVRVVPFVVQACRPLMRGLSKRQPLPEYSSICVSRSSGYEMRTSVDPAVGAGDRLELRLHESGVRRQIQAFDARDHFVAQRGIEMHRRSVSNSARAAA